MDAMQFDEDLDEWLWPASCPELRQMESALRCLICGDFFHGPVLLPCTHTFCSECVRRFLQSRGNNGCCPECKQPCAPSELVPNRTLEKIGVLFQQMKPKVLPVLEKAKVPDHESNSTAANGGKAANGDGKPPERMTLVSYNVMKDKDIKKLLETIGIRAPVKNRDDIIQIHKEYVLLANAQADSSHPKSAKQVREEVMRNYRARQAEKQSNSSVRKSLDSTQAPVVTAEMQAGFERLRQQVKARANQQKPKQEDDGDEGKRSSNGTQHEGDDDESDGSSEDGTWRHVYVVKADLDFYIHSTTQEIRTEPPPEFLEHQQRLKERREKAAVTADEESRDDDDDDEPVVVGTRSAPPSQTEATAIESAQDDDDDFEIVMTSPPPKPSLCSRNSTPQSARKKAAERRRSSTGSSSSISAAAAAFFSQETSCSIQETSTQLAPSASLSVPSQIGSSNSSGRVGIDLSASDVALSASPQAPPTDTKWECPRCTLVNESTDAVAECEACGYRHQQRPLRKKQKLQFQSKIFQP